MAEDKNAINHYWSLHPRFFSVLDRLQLVQQSTGESPASILTLELWLRPFLNAEDDKRRLHLTFENVTDLKMNPHGFIQIFLLEIISIKEDQWENLNYKVAETEYNQLSFYCKRFEADIVSDRF